MKTLYVSDLDGTLLRPDETMSAYSIDVINRFTATGFCFSYATARSLVTAEKVTAGLNAAIPVITYNGAFIIDNTTRKIILSNFFTADEAGYVRLVLTECGVSPIVYAYVDGIERFSYLGGPQNEGIRFFIDSRIGDPRRREVCSPAALYCGEPFYFTCIGTEAELTPIHRILKSDKRYSCIFHKDIYSDAQWCELLPAEATKAHAIVQLKALLGCDSVVSFGDGRNDLAMFGISDACYAVENAVPELKAVATAVIGGNRDDGVARWFEQNVLQP